MAAPCMASSPWQSARSISMALTSMSCCQTSMRNTGAQAVSNLTDHVPVGRACETKFSLRYSCYRCRFFLLAE